MLSCVLVFSLKLSFWCLFLSCKLTEVCRINLLVNGQVLQNLDQGPNDFNHFSATACSVMKSYLQVHVDFMNNLYEFMQKTVVPSLHSGYYKSPFGF